MVDPQPARISDDLDQVRHWLEQRLRPVPAPRMNKAQARFAVAFKQTDHNRQHADMACQHCGFGHCACDTRAQRHRQELHLRLDIETKRVPVKGAPNNYGTGRQVWIDNAVRSRMNEMQWSESAAGDLLTLRCPSTRRALARVLRNRGALSAVVCVDPDAQIKQRFAPACRDVAQRWAEGEVEQWIRADYDKQGRNWQQTKERIAGKAKPAPDLHWRNSIQTDVKQLLCSVNGVVGHVRRLSSYTFEAHVVGVGKRRFHDMHQMPEAAAHKWVRDTVTARLAAGHA